MFKMRKEVIVTDIYAVLFPFVDTFSRWHNQEYGTDLSRDDFNSYEFNDTLGVSVPETVHRVHQFLSMDHVLRGVEPLEHSMSAISKLSGEYSLKAITARHPQFEGVTRDYLLRYFTNNIVEMTLVGTEATMNQVRTKAEVCLEVGAIALIDDSTKHVSECVEGGITGILFGDYPWNRVNSLPDGVIRYSNWGGVLRHFDV